MLVAEKEMVAMEKRMRMKVTMVVMKMMMITEVVGGAWCA